ncbi:MAG: hypothetical protein ACI828_002676, partial [Flavobacteriales bacterium]
RVTQPPWFSLFTNLYLKVVEWFIGRPSATL